MNVLNTFGRVGANVTAVTRSVFAGRDTYASSPSRETISVNGVLQVTGKQNPQSQEHVAAEQYRKIRTRIANHASQPRIILVTSPNSGDGKTTTSIHIAAAMSLQENARVLLVDCDFRCAGASCALNLGPSPGLKEHLSNSAELDGVLSSVAGFPQLFVLPSGVAPCSPAEMLTTRKWHDFLEQALSDFELLILDGPSFDSVVEYELLQMASHGVIFVVRQEHTNRDAWTRARNSVPQEKQLGLVLNCA